MLALAARADKNGICWPGLNQLAHDCGLARSTVAMRLPSIKLMGEITIEHRGHKRRDGRSNRYQIILSAPVADSPGIGLTGTPIEEPREAGVVQLPDVGSSDRRTSHSPVAGPEPSENRHGEPSVYRQKSTVHLTGQRIDYATAVPPEITDYCDIVDPDIDPILIAMAVTGERAKLAWGYWVKTLNIARRTMGREKAEQIFRDCCSALYGEMKSEECQKPGAKLNIKLQIAYSLQRSPQRVQPPPLDCVA